MKLERTKNTKRNIFFGIINKIVTLILPFIIRTILIKIIGVEYAGLNSLFTSILQVLNLTELGFGSAVVYSMYKPIAENDSKMICALLNFYKKVYKIIGIIILIVGICLTPFLPYFVKGDCPPNINLYLLYFIYLINTVSTYLLFAYKSALLSAHQRTDVISNIMTITQGLMYIFQIIALILTKNYYLYIIFLPIFTVVNNIINAIIVKKMYPEYICKGNLDKKVLMEIKQKVSGLMINKLCATTRNTFDSIFISSFLGLTVTAIYGNYYYIINSILGIISVLAGSMLAGVGNSIQTESINKNYEDLKKFNFLYMWISGWCTVCLACLYQPFIKLWLGEKFLFKYSVVILLCAYFYLLKMGDIRGMYSDAAGLWWENRYRAIIESVANLILNFLFVKFLGIYGIILATLISLFFINFIGGSHIVFKYYFKNGKLKEYFCLHLKYCIVTIIVTMITIMLCSLIKGNDIIILIIRGIICCIIPNILYWLFYRKTSEYKVSIPWILDKLKKK